MLNTKTVPVSFISFKELRSLAEWLYGEDMLDEVGNFGAATDHGLHHLTPDIKAWDSSSLTELWPSTLQILARLRDLGEISNGYYYIARTREYEKIGV